MLEPLKNKRINISQYKAQRLNHLYKEEDIKSAVEWLKDRIDYFESEFDDFRLAREFKIMINQAFEDVIKGSHNGENNNAKL